MSRVMHFEIHAADPERAVAFYKNLFGWDITSWGGPNEYWVIRTGDAGTPGIDGGLLRRRGPEPSAESAVNCFVCTIDVPNVDEAVTKATSIGGSLALPKMAISGIGWLAYCKDTEGNIFGMMQHDVNAK